MRRRHLPGAFVSPLGAPGIARAQAAPPPHTRDSGREGLVQRDEVRSAKTSLGIVVGRPGPWSMVDSAIQWEE